MPLTATLPPRTSSIPLLLGSSGIVATVGTGIAISASGAGPTALDTAWHDLMRSWRTAPGIAIATWMQSAGGVGVMVAVGLVLTAALLVMRRPRSALTLAVTMILTEGMTGVLKVLVARPRPADSLSDTALTSFPSGHTALAAATMVVLALLLGRWFWGLAAVWVTAMAWSRTYLEAHWFSDVLAGAVLGTSVALLVWWGAKMIARRLGRPSARTFTTTYDVEPGRG